MINNIINKVITFFNPKYKINLAIKESIEKNEKILEKLGDKTDYNSKGKYGKSSTSNE